MTQLTQCCLGLNLQDLWFLKMTCLSWLSWLTRATLSCLNPAGLFRLKPANFYNNKITNRGNTKEKQIHPFFRKSDIGSANLQIPKKMPTSAKLKSSFKPEKLRKYRRVQNSNNSSIMDYFKIESKPNLDLCRQSDLDKTDKKDPKLLLHQ